MNNAIKLRYNLIRYYYTQFQSISEVGGAFFKPLAFEWSSDPKAYLDIANNIQLGKALKLSIQVSDLKKTTTQYYFPKARWCMLYPTISGVDCFNSVGEYKEFPSAIDEYQLHMRGGYIIPY